MVEVPAATPETIPDEDTVALLVLLLLHVPAPPSVSAVVAPMQTLGLPLIAPGNGLIVTGMDVVQPVPSVKVIDVVPLVTPDTWPLAGSTVATLVLLLFQVPVPSVNIVTDPIHAWVTPVIAPGSGFTVIGYDALQLVPSEKVMVAVPVATPKTLPRLETVAILVLLLVHVPRPVSVSAADEPMQTPVGPVIGVAVDTTVTVVVAMQPVLKV